jgi:hypothetical protein
LEAHRSFGPERSKARRREIFSSKRCGGLEDPYPMQVAARATVKAVRGSGFFFLKLDDVVRLLSSSSDGVDGRYGCGTSSSPSPLASIVPKGSKRSRTKTARVWRVLVKLQMKIEANPINIYRAFSTIS